MPGGDRTGPMGQGSRTGRAFGFCSGNNTPGYLNEPGNGQGRGRGIGRGVGNNFGKRMGRGSGPGRGRNRFFQNNGNPSPAESSETSRQDEINMLKSEIEALDRSRKDIEKRLEELGKE